MPTVAETLDLLDWRRRISALYEEIRDAADPEAASAVTTAACEAGDFQVAAKIAAAYQVEFDDDTLMEMVRQAAQRAGPEAGLRGTAKRAIDDIRRGVVAVDGG